MTTFRSCLGSCLVGVGILALLALLVLANAAYGGEAYCDACLGDSGWDPLKKLDEIGNPNAGKAEVMPGLSTAQKNRVGIWKQPLAGFNKTNASEEINSLQENVPVNNTTKSLAEKIEPRKMAEENTSIVRSANARGLLAPIDEVSSTDILLDISLNAPVHIKGAIAIPYTEFLHDGNFRSVEEISEILGKAGISSEDSVDVYGECLPCGGGPAPAALTYLIFKSLGHKKVKVLDGTVNDWALAGKPTANETTVRPPKVYLAQPTNDSLASYDYVESGLAQIIDARSMQDYGNGSIPDAINIPADSMVRDGRIKDEAKLERLFAILNKDQPVVVYTGQPTKGSVAWFSLKLIGFDVKLYSYENYLINQRTAKQAELGNATA